MQVIILITTKASKYYCEYYYGRAVVKTTTTSTITKTHSFYDGMTVFRFLAKRRECAYKSVNFAIEYSY